jgi:hypothetical protein
VNVASQLAVTVYGPSDTQSFVPSIGANQALFVFENAVGTGSSITEVYFDDGTLLDIATVTDSGAGVSFVEGANPPDLPGGASLSPPFQVTAGFLAQSTNPPPFNGVSSATEWLAILFDLQSGQDYDDVVAALGLGGVPGGLRVGMHVISIAGAGPNDSDSFVNNPPATLAPEPSTILSALVAGFPIGVIALRRHRFRRLWSAA